MIIKKKTEGIIIKNNNNYKLLKMNSTCFKKLMH